MGSMQSKNAAATLNNDIEVKYRGITAAEQVAQISLCH